MTDAPALVVTRYLAAADARDSQALADCFTADGTVSDEGVTHRGHGQIVGWREGLAAKWTYTTKVTESQPLADGQYLGSVRVEGDFPGGVADLRYLFALRDELIADLSIAE